MSDWLYEYRKLVKEIDRLAKADKDIYFQVHWEYLKHVLSAHARFLQGGGLTREESLSEAWSAFEDAFSTEEEPSGTNIVLHAIPQLYVDGSPDGKEGWYNYHLEIGFGQARGFSREEAIKQQDAFLADEGGFEAFYGQPDPRIKKRRRTTNRKLKLIQGGKK